MTRTCKKCKVEKPLTHEFFVYERLKKCFWHECRDCTNKKNNISNKRRRYGIEPEQYESLLVKQAGVCAICGTKPNGKTLAVDHCHKTQKIRGLLCLNCNSLLGHCKDDPSRLLKAIHYLSQ